MRRGGRNGPLLALILLASGCGMGSEEEAPVGEVVAGAREAPAPAGPAPAAAGPAALYLVGPGGRTHRLVAGPPPDALVVLDESGVCGETVDVVPTAAHTGPDARDLTPMLEIPGWGERIVRRPLLAFRPGFCPPGAGRLRSEWYLWSSQASMDRSVLDTIRAAAEEEGTPVVEAAEWTLGDTTWTWAIVGTPSAMRLVGLSGRPGTYRIEHDGPVEGWIDRTEYARLVAFGDLRGDGRLTLVLTVPTASPEWSARQNVRVWERTLGGTWELTLDRPLMEVLYAG